MDCFIEDGDEAVNLLVSIDDAELNGSILGETPVTRSANAAAGSVALNSSEHDRFCDLQFPAFGQNCFVQGLAIPLIVFSKVNAKYSA